MRSKHQAKATRIIADLGGTWLRVRAEGAFRRNIRCPAPPPERLAAKLRGILRAWRINPDELIVGSRGVWTQRERRAMGRRLPGLAKRVRVTSDVELAYEQVLGFGPGILILAGTGSIALAKDGRGRTRRAGGLGPAKGDEGSAYWIGRQYRARVLGKPSLPPTRANVRRTAALAPTVLARARRDPLCAKIIGEAQAHLATLAAKLARGRCLRVGFWGGLMENRNFRQGVLRRIRAGIS
jgi:N-acetylglucosamine kinase-like BadF-type ATPase